MDLYVSRDRRLKRVSYSALTIMIVSIGYHGASNNAAYLSACKMWERLPASTMDLLFLRELTQNFMLIDLLDLHPSLLHPSLFEQKREIIELNSRLTIRMYRGCTQSA